MFCHKLFSHIIYVISTDVEHEIKDAYYSVLITMRIVFQTDSFPVLENHIFMAFKDINGPPFIKARLAMLFGAYGDIEIQNENKVVSTI